MYPLGSSIGGAIAYGHEHDSLFRTTVPALLADDEPRICEVGSNIGASLLQILAAKPRARILAFEPSHMYRSFLECNLELAGIAQVEILPLLVGERVGLGHLYTDGSSGSRRGMAHHTKRQLAEMTTLDVVCREQRVDFLKIDTDGFDLEVLRGAEATLRRERPVVHFEFAPYLMPTDAQGELAWLQGLGYRHLVCLHPGGLLLGTTTDPAQAVAWASEATYCDILACAAGTPAELRLTDLVAASGGIPPMTPLPSITVRDGSGGGDDAAAASDG